MPGVEADADVAAMQRAFYQPTISAIVASFMQFCSDTT